MLEESPQDQVEKLEWGTRMFEGAEAILEVPEEITLPAIVLLAGVFLIYLVVRLCMEYFSSNGNPPSIF